MFKILLFCGLCYASVGGIYASLRHIQMLQQNSYFPSRYFGWLKSSFSTVSAISAAAVFALWMLAAFDVLMWFMFLSLAVSLIRIVRAFKLQNNSIKKLVFTARIKRLIFAESFVLAALCVLFAFLPGWLSLIVLTLIFASPALMLAAYYINAYPEKAITEYYIRDAKKILASSPRLKVIGITGSYGKTGTKFILQKLLSKKYNVVVTPGSFNTPMGVVRTVRENLRNDTEVFICEMGAKNVGDIKEICDIAHPDTALITSVGPQHLETFKTLDNVFKTKFELSDAVNERGGVCFVNIDSAPIAERKDTIRGKTVFFGTGIMSHCKAENITYSRFGSTFTVSLPTGQSIELQTSLLGRHNVCNITGAVALAVYMGVEAEDIKLAVSRLSATEHRLELKNWVGGSVMIDDAYNANPEGCIEAVNVLNSFTGMKKIIITPGLVELGSREYEFNYNLGLAAAKICDKIILVGKKRAEPMKKAAEDSGYNMDNVFVVNRFDEAVSLLAPTLDANTVVLIENDLPDNYAK